MVQPHDVRNLFFDMYINILTIKKFHGKSLRQKNKRLRVMYRYSMPKLKKQKQSAVAKYGPDAFDDYLSSVQ